MIAGKFHLTRVAGLLLGTGGFLFAGPFAAPSAGPVAFRRDRVPLDAETMAGLSRQLLTLAKGLDAGTPVSRRTAAQMLALSTALDPGNNQARELISEFEKESHRPVADPQNLERSRSRIWQYLGWLETPDAGSDGQALGACLTDVIVISDPDHPRAAELRTAAERGVWKGWVPPLAAYEEKPPDHVGEPVDNAPAVAETGILLAKAAVFTPLWKRDSKVPPVSWSLTSGELEMTATLASNANPKPFSIAIGSQDSANSLSPLIPPLLATLESVHGKLPAGGRVVISSPALDESLLARKPQSLSAAVAVLASSAISGREPNATILGLIDETGAFKLPTGFWTQLQSLAPGNGGRLILPAEAAEFLPSMLALENPQIFFDYEILLAANFQELLDLSAKSPAEAIAKPMALFREIREKAGPLPLGQYVANPFIRRRLAEIVQEAPYHQSAKMLAIQGAGNRPAFVPRLVLAAELRRAIVPLEWVVRLVSPAAQSFETDRLATTYEVCRTQVDRLLRYADSKDRELIDQVQDMVTTIRTLDRATKARTSADDLDGPTAVAYNAVKLAYVDIVGKLATVTGETEPTAAP